MNDPEKKVEISLTKDEWEKISFLAWEWFNHVKSMVPNCSAKVMLESTRDLLEKLDEQTHK